MTIKEKALLKMLAMMARIIGDDVKGFYSYKLDEIINEMDKAATEDTEKGF